MTEIFHLADRQQWEAARSDGSYEISTRGRTLAEVGFIHCSQRHQVRGVADAVFGGADDLVLLTIDPERVPVPIRFEGPDYPHIYGPLPADAVVAVTPVQRDATGRLVLPTDEPAR
ncbi:MAG TPA: DUF952 domain-containing protein [Mycobacteriales bacterium]|nr:DUF952 domain-containing protein [Mycobacteriales bacterium]